MYLWKEWVIGQQASGTQTPGWQSFTDSSSHGGGKVTTTSANTLHLLSYSPRRDTSEREREELGKSVTQGDGGMLNLEWKRQRSCWKTIWERRFLWHSLASALLCACVSSGFSGFIPFPKKIAGTWIGYAQLPLGVNDCANVCAWCLSMDWHPIQGLFPSREYTLSNSHQMLFLKSLR